MGRTYAWALAASKSNASLRHYTCHVKLYLNVKRPIHIVDVGYNILTYFALHLAHGADCLCMRLETYVAERTSSDLRRNRGLSDITTLMLSGSLTSTSSILLWLASFMADLCSFVPLCYLMWFLCYRLYFLHGVDATMISGCLQNLLPSSLATCGFNWRDALFGRGRLRNAKDAFLPLSVSRFLFDNGF